MREYSREEKMALCKKSNQNRKEGKDNFEGFSKEDKLALALLIDGKDPNDDYDLVNLLKTKYGKKFNAVVPTSMTSIRNIKIFFSFFHFFFSFFW